MREIPATSGSASETPAQRQSQPDSAPERPVLLFIVNVDWFFISHRLPIAEAALRCGYRVHVACAITECQQEIEKQGIVLHELKFSRAHQSPRDELRTVASMLRLLREIKPDVLHLVTIKPVLLGAITARLLGIKNIVAAVSGLGFVFVSKGFKAKVRRAMVSILYRIALGSRSTIAIFQNAADANLVARIANLKAQQIRMIRGSGVDLARFSPQPLPEGEPLLTFAARLLADKGLREFVRAAYVLRSRGVKARFVIAGDADLDNPASIGPEELKAWQLEGVVEVVGHVADVRELFARSHVVVLPSYREGLPKVLLEAAACGRAVITSDVPGCRDAVIAGTTALLVPPESVERLADAMEQLIKDREHCAELGRAGRRLAEEAFGIDGVINAHLAIYHELMSRER